MNQVINISRQIYLSYVHFVYFYATRFRLLVKHQKDNKITGIFKALKEIF
jgi:hypothetical protein